jgi:hypothetical protein
MSDKPYKGKPTSGLEREFINVMLETERVLARAYDHIYNPEYKNLINSKKDLEYFTAMCKKARKMIDDLFK